jgi:hypothetical protein
VADREVNLNVNLKPGQDTLAAALEQQRKKAAELQQQIEQIKGWDPDPGSAAEKKLQKLRGQLESLNREMAAAAPPGAGQFSGAEVRGATERARERQREGLLRDVGQARATGVIPANQITAAGAAGAGPGGVARGFSEAAGAMGAVQSGAAGLVGVLSKVPGPFGILAGAAGAVAGVVASLADRFRRFRPELAELLGELERSRGRLGRARGGLPTAQDVIETLTPAEQAQYQRAGNRGDVGEQRRIVQGALERHQQTVGRLNPERMGQARAELEELFRETMEAQRGSPGGRLMSEQRLMMMGRLGQIVERYGLRPEDLPAGLGGLMGQGMTEEHVRNISTSVTTGAVAQAQAGAATAGALLRGGVLPSITPGAVNLADISTGFQSRQQDVLDVHAEVQREVVRDQRQQAQFQELMDQLREIYRRMNPTPGLTPDAAGGLMGGAGLAMLPWLLGGGGGWELPAAS